MQNIRKGGMRGEFTEWVGDQDWAQIGSDVLGAFTPDEGGQVQYPSQYPYYLQQPPPPPPPPADNTMTYVAVGAAALVGVAMIMTMKK